MLGFTDGKIDKAALAQAENIHHAVNDQNDAGKVSHMLGPCYISTSFD